MVGDLTDQKFVERVIRFSGISNFYHQTPESFQEPFDEIYQYAADMGGAGYIFSGENDSEVMYNSATVNLNILKSQLELNKKKELNKIRSSTLPLLVFPEYAQEETNNPGLRESDAYPAGPDLNMVGRSVL